MLIAESIGCKNSIEGFSNAFTLWTNSKDNFIKRIIEF